MNELRIFNYGEQEIRTLLIADDPWWVLTDVCKVLMIKHTATVSGRLDDDEKAMHQITDRQGRSQDVIIINESGLYSVILRSDKAEAKIFKRWITHEVLPTIRRTGSYSMGIQPSAETGLQKASLLIRAAEHKAVPKSEQLRLLDVAVKDLTGKGLDFSSPEPQPQAVSIMDLPETSGYLKKGKTVRHRNCKTDFYTLTEIADKLGVSCAEFSDFMNDHNLKTRENGDWERVSTPYGDAREFLYAGWLMQEYREEMNTNA